MSNHKFRENISDKGLRQFFNERNNTPNKRYKDTDYTRLRNQYFVLLDAYRTEQKRVKKETASAFSKLDRQFKTGKKSFTLNLDYLRERNLMLSQLLKVVLTNSK